VKLKELVSVTNWDQAKSSLLQAYPESESIIGKLKSVFHTLQSLNPSETKMRLYLQEVLCEGSDQDSYIDVFGQDGTVNRELPDFHHFAETASTEFAESETTFALELTQWDEWLGMRIDRSTQQSYSHDDIVAHCLWEMTFYGFDQATIQNQKEEIDRRIMELENMSEGEKKSKLIPLEEVMEKFKTTTTNRRKSRRTNER
jgi:hypothetical protein